MAGEAEKTMTDRKLAGQLAWPSTLLQLDQLEARWRQISIEWTVLCRDPIGPAPGLVSKIRGSMGDVLLRAASPAARDGKPCSFTPPCGLDILFRSQGRLTKAMELPKPFVIRADMRGRRLRVELCLFGMAEAWQGEIGAAMTDALYHHVDGISPAEIDSRTMTEQDLAPSKAPDPDQVVILRSLTPLQLRFKEAPHDDPSKLFTSLVSSLGNRISGLARWQGVELDADWSLIKATAQRANVACLDKRSQHWERRSSRSGHTMPLSGELITLRLSGALTPLWPLLALGLHTHAGSHTSFGLGRYVLER